MIKKDIRIIFSTLFLVATLSLPFFVFAETLKSSSGALDKLKSVAGVGGYSSASETSLASTLGMIVNALLSLLGVVFIILIIYGGFQWMTAGGNDDAVKKAKERIKNAIIGLIITISAFAIWRLIASVILKTPLN